jgi:hypothetical protein
MKSKKQQRLFDLANRFASPIPYRCAWDHLDDSRQRRAHASDWSRAYRDDAREDYKQFAEQDERNAEISRRCMTAILDEYRELNRLVAEVWPELLGMVPIFELGENRPPDDEFMEMGQKVKGLIGELLRLQKKSAPNGAKPPAKSPVLTPTQIKILRALQKLRATGQDLRVTARQLCPHVDKQTKPGVLKEPLAGLRRLHFIDSLGPRRDGGYWLTPSGISRLAEIEKDRKR